MPNVRMGMTSCSLLSYSNTKAAEKPVKRRSMKVKVCKEGRPGMDQTDAMLTLTAGPNTAISAAIRLRWQGREKGDCDFFGCWSGLDSQ